MQTTQHQLKIDRARECIRACLEHVAGAGGADEYATREEAFSAARQEMGEFLDTSQIEEAFEPFDD